uniref:Uncharacterized protein n=1 Tax=Oryza nivara TaxID=4536 RepID=A0A0E0GDE0_ORYNI
MWFSPGGVASWIAHVHIVLCIYKLSLIVVVNLCSSSSTTAASTRPQWWLDEGRLDPHLPRPPCRVDLVDVVRFETPPRRGPLDGGRGEAADHRRREEEEELKLEAAGWGEAGPPTVGGEEMWSPGAVWARWEATG